MAAEMHDSTGSLALFPAENIHPRRRATSGHGETLLPQPPFDKLAGYLERMNFVAELFQGLSDEPGAVGVVVPRRNRGVHPDELLQKADHLVPDLIDRPFDAVPIT